jgi:hypothetical protein
VHSAAAGRILSEEHAFPSPLRVPPWSALLKTDGNQSHQATVPETRIKATPHGDHSESGMKPIHSSSNMSAWVFRLLRRKTPDKIR